MMFRVSRLTVLRLSGLVSALVVILFINTLIADPAYPVMAEFGLLIYFYYSFKPHAGGLKTMAVHGALAFMGFGILLALPNVVLLKAAFLATLAAVTMALGKRFFSNAPGPFFVMMIASLGGTIEVTSVIAGKEWLYLLVGIVISIIAAACVEGLTKAFLHAPFAAPLPVMTRQKRAFLSSAYGAVLFFVYLANLTFPFRNYNWLTVSAAANLKADAPSAAFKRYGSYILGNIAGVFFVWGVSLFSPSVSVLLLLTAILFVAIAVVIPFNYGLALACATPLAVFLFDILHGTLDNGLITVRLVSIAIGSLIGIVCDLLMIKGLAHMPPEH